MTSMNTASVWSFQAWVSDGTLGLRAIKEKAGVVFVQEPASAKFDGMPRSAIEAGLADVVAPVEALPDKISAYPPPRTADQTGRIGIWW